MRCRNVIGVHDNWEHVSLLWRKLWQNRTGIGAPPPPSECWCSQPREKFLDPLTRSSWSDTQWADPGILPWGAILHYCFKRVWGTKKKWTERVTRVPRPSPDAPMDHTYPQLYFVSKRGSTLITAYSSSMFTFYVLANICKCVPVKIANSTFVVPLAFVPEKRKYPRL